jgi:hypothetical protein
VHSEAVRVHVHDGTAMTPATSQSTNLSFIVGSRNEKTTVYGYVYEYVYGQEKGNPNDGFQGTRRKARP